MDFLVAGVTVDPLLLAGVGFLVGIMGGFFEVGDGRCDRPSIEGFALPCKGCSNSRSNQIIINL